MKSKMESHAVDFEATIYSTGHRITWVLCCPAPNSHDAGRLGPDSQTYHIARYRYLKHRIKQVCRSLLFGRNVHWPRRMLPPGESRSLCQRDRETDGRTPDRYITLFAGRGQCNEPTKRRSNTWYFNVFILHIHTYRFIISLPKRNKLQDNTNTCSENNCKNV